MDFKIIFVKYGLVFGILKFFMTQFRETAAVMKFILLFVERQQYTMK